MDRSKDKLAKARKQKKDAFPKGRQNMKDQATRAEIVRKLKDAEDEYMEAVSERADLKNLIIKGTRRDGRGFRLIDFDENDLPVYEIDENVNAAISTATDQVRSSITYNNVDGSGVTIGLWEASGTPRITHQEFEGRVTIEDGSTNVSSHATHVAGTLAAAGIASNVKGMAPEANILAFISGGADAEMMANGAAAPNTSKLYISNHSYGVGQGWTSSSSNDYDWIFSGTFVDDNDPSTDYEADFGRYSSSAVTWDNITYSLPYYLPFISSGNQRGDNPSNGQTVRIYGVNYTYDNTKHPLGDRHYKSDWDNMEGRKLSKNVIVVGNTSDAVNGGVRDASKAVTSSSSSRGPADDGRIKPDIVANGVSLLSTDDGSDTDTGTKSGTSMATPNACGSAALLIDYFTSRFPSQSMRASTLKALILHTADDRGRTGPDYKYGWGLMNTQAAADVIKLHADGNGGAHMLEALVNDTTTPSQTHSFDWDGGSPLRVTLCWTDPAGTQKTGHENRTKTLVNDLNLKVTGPGGTHYPYVMPHVGDWSIGSIDVAATTGVNDVDNVEQVYLAAPTVGNYTVTIDYVGNLTNDEQDYSLIITGQTAIAVEMEVKADGPPVVTLNSDGAARNFGSVGPSDPAVIQSYTIRNTGSTPITGLNITKSGSHPSDFTLGGLSPTELYTNETASFTVSYAPLDLGTQTAQINIVSNESNENPFVINLTARGLNEFDAWRLVNFNTTTRRGNFADNADFDNDGNLNIVEFAMATDPTTSNPAPITFTDNASTIELIYDRNVHAMADYDFQVVWNDDLTNTDGWFDTDVTEQILNDDGSVQEVKATVPKGSSTQRFLQLSITPK